MERNFTKLPMEWVERIFERMECIYKDRWTSLVGNEGRKSILKTMWSTGLSGLDAHAIKKALSMCESFPHASIPTHIEFYHYAKGIRTPVRTSSVKYQSPNAPQPGNPEVAKEHLAKIREQLSSKCSTRNIK